MKNLVHIEPFVEMYDDSLPKLLTRWLDYFDTNPQKASKKIHRHPNTVYKWLNGYSYPNSLDIATICEVYKLDPRYFFPGNNISIQEADLSGGIKEKEKEEIVKGLELSFFATASENKKRMFSEILNGDEKYVERILKISEIIRI